MLPCMLLLPMLAQSMVFSKGRSMCFFFRLSAAKRQKMVSKTFFNDKGEEVTEMVPVEDANLPSAPRDDEPVQEAASTAADEQTAATVKSEPQVRPPVSSCSIASKHLSAPRVTFSPCVFRSRRGLTVERQRQRRHRRPRLERRVQRCAVLPNQFGLHMMPVSLLMQIVILRRACQLGREASSRFSTRRDLPCTSHAHAHGLVTHLVTHLCLRTHIFGCELTGHTFGHTSLVAN